MCCLNAFVKPKNYKSIVEWYSLKSPTNYRLIKDHSDEITDIFRAGSFIVLCKSLFDGKMDELSKDLVNKSSQPIQQDKKIELIEREKLLRCEFKRSIYETMAVAIGVLFIASILGTAGGGLPFTVLAAVSLHRAAKACTGIYHYQKLSPIHP